VRSNSISYKGLLRRLLVEVPKGAVEASCPVWFFFGGITDSYAPGPKPGPIVGGYAPILKLSSRGSSLITNDIYYNY